MSGYCDVGILSALVSDMPSLGDTLRRRASSDASKSMTG
eukprot:CAMPEP_0113898076 /NCGR_PEP_ID=MMETSP0780_2-20120614/19117_1 /TAXON_ID=652834 /ORGANISM="Palpitomonas bilix" /LENGTH=38 /DNA_ID=CAMNT_0000889777 /DNA_START=90 /DNA_END=206 /DNA_ORIENTATION=+ /assembly_acc=CAM_ASM_000599